MKSEGRIILLLGAAALGVWLWLDKGGGLGKITGALGNEAKATGKLAKKVIQDNVTGRPTATDKQERSGGKDVTVGGKYKTFLSPTLQAYFQDPKAKAWLNSAAGQAWAKQMDAYLKAHPNYKSAGAIPEYAVPLPSSAPTVKLKSGAIISGGNPGADYKKAQDAKKKKDAAAASDAKKRLDALRNEFGTGPGTLSGRMA